MNQLIHCTNCDAVFMKTPFDQEPEYEPPSMIASYSGRATERDDFGDFMKNHDGHRLQDLTIVKDSMISDGNYIEPIKVSYFRATNGRENFVIRKFREKIGEPLRYELIAGDYSLTCVSLEVQSKEIGQQLAREFKQITPSQNKIDSFIRLYDHIVKTVDVKNLERVSEESPNPLEVYYKMDDMTFMYLMRNCHHIFKGQEYAEIEKFINRHKDDGVLLLKATYRIQIVEQSKEQRRAVSRAVPSERETLKVKEMI